MPNVALRGVPEDVHCRLKDAARANHRSLNGEILARLVASVPAGPERDEPRVSILYEPRSAEELRARARKRGEAIRARGGIDLSPERIEALVQEGRSR